MIFLALIFLCFILIVMKYPPKKKSWGWIFLAGTALLLLVTKRFGWAAAAVTAGLTWINKGFQFHRFWQKASPFFDQASRQTQTSQPSAMTEKQAYEILDLQQGACVEDIKKAHRRLIQKLHPDQGGSAYLAAQLNQARDMLLKHKTKS